MDQHLISCLKSLWNAAPNHRGNLLSMAEFKAVLVACEPYMGSFTIGTLDTFPFLTALRTLGLSIDQPKKSCTVDFLEMAQRLINTCQSSVLLRTHYCPLDLADELPEIKFGKAAIRRFSEDELARAFDLTRLGVHFPNAMVNFARLSDMQWLVVQEEVAVSSGPAGRAHSFFAEPIEQDWGAVRPHESGWPAPVEDALFLLLLQPWETWVEVQRSHIFGFEIPWIYTVHTDLFKQPNPPPPADSLSFNFDVHIDRFGDEHEVEVPARYSLRSTAQSELSALNQTAWEALQRAKRSPLFKPPIQHFLVKAFQAKGVDEFMAHITAIDAAVGTANDHYQPNRTTYSTLGSTVRVGTRLAALVNDPEANGQFFQLFKLRSDFVHGRADVKDISTAQRVGARSLARRAAKALLDMASREMKDRETQLEQLLDAGVALTGNTAPR